jgi:hypothetical protein
MHCITIYFFLLPLLSVNASEEYFKGNIITDIKTTRRCDELVQERNEKLILKNKILGLLSKNQKLKEGTAENRKSLLDLLNKNLEELNQFLKKTSDKINSSGEEIIRIGCPGIIL